MNLTLRQLRAFQAVAETGSFTRAADRLNLTQSATSGLIRELEREVGVRLFDRTTRRVDLTASGREFILSVGRLLAGLDHSVREVRDLAEMRRGRLAIGAPPLLAATIVPPLVARFLDHHAAIQIVLADVPTEQILARIESGELDCGIGTFPPAGDGDGDRRAARTVQTPFLSDRLHLVCPRGHPFAGRPDPCWADLQGVPLILLTGESGVRTLIDAALSAAGVEIAPAYEVAQMTTALALVDAGLGLSILPSYALAMGGRLAIEVRLLNGPPVSREISIATAAGRSPTPATSAFIRFALAERANPVSG